MHKHDTPRWDEQAWGTAAGRLRGIKLTLCVLVGCVVLAGSLGLWIWFIAACVRAAQGLGWLP